MNVDPAWQANSLDLDGYLARIGYTGPREATLATLTAVHRAHVSTIPFENIDLILGTVNGIDVSSVQDRLVGQRRGGNCFDHNVLLGAALECLGFPVTRLLVRTLLGAPPGALPVVHTGLLVDVAGERWLADAGLGGEGLIEPIRLADGATAEVGAWSWRLDLVDDSWVLRTMHDTGWFDLYTFTTERRYPIDYTVGSFFALNSPQSQLATWLLVQRASPDTKYFLMRRTLITMSADGTTDRRNLTTEEIPGCVRDLFGIPLTDEKAAELAAVTPPPLPAGVA